MLEDEDPDELSKLRIELAKRDQQLAAVRTISHALSTMTNLDDLVKQTLEVSLGTIHASAGAFYLYDEKQDKLVFRYVINTDVPEAASVLIGKTLDPGQGVAGQVFQSGEPSIDDNPMQHKGHMRQIGESTGYITRNMVTLPLVSMRGKTIGAMQAINKQSGNFDQDDLELLTIMATQAATAIENARLYEQARQASIMHYLGDVSHDIKNLMTPAKTGAETLEMILSGTFDDLDRLITEGKNRVLSAEHVADACRTLQELYPEMIEMVVESIDGAQERVREIADAVKGVISEPVFEVASIDEIVHSVVKALKLVAEQRGVTIDASGLCAGEAIFIDRKRMHTALYNLVNNAIPETPRGGAISIRTRAAIDGDLPDGRFVMIEVADTGNGMPDDVKERLFTENAISTKPGGTGLGTKIVKNAVDAHGGRIWVESALGAGTTFYVQLPYRTA